MWCCKLAQCEACRSQHGCGEMRELEVLEGGAQPRQRFELLLTPRLCSPGTFERILRAQVPIRGVAPCFRLK